MGGCGVVSMRSMLDGNRKHWATFGLERFDMFCPRPIPMIQVLPW